MNPFLDILKADILSPEQVSKLFVPEASPIWNALQRPINQIVIGPRGAGKTIALKQFSQKITSLPEGESFLGTYLQISRICTMFGSIFDHAREAHDDSLRTTFIRIFTDYVWLEICREVIEFLESREDLIPVNDLRRVFCFETHSIKDANVHRSKLSTDIEEAIQAWSVNPSNLTYTPKFDLPQSLDRCAKTLRAHVPELAQNRPCLYLLLDESSPIPLECQAAMNCLLHRGRSFCVKLAIRPYEWTTLTSTTGRPIELDTDVWPLRIRYPLHAEYSEQMAKVVSRVLDNQLSEQDLADPIQAMNRIFPFDSTLPYSGFDAMARASSDNPQNMLQICSYIFGSTTFQSTTSFQAKTQDRVVRAWSQDYEDRNPYQDSRFFCRALLRRIRSASTATVGFKVVEQEDDLFSNDYIRQPFGKLIQSGFAVGFLRPIHPDNARSLFEIPATFSVSPGLLPTAKLPLELPIEPLTEIDGTFIRTNTRDRPRRSQELEQRREMKAFLSTSFSAAIKQQRFDIKEHLGRIGVHCEDVEDQPDSQFLFSAIVKKIRECDFVVLDATVLRPFTMLEIGICAGVPRKPKNVVCVINEEHTQSIHDLPNYIQSLPILTFSFNAGRLKELASNIVNRAEGLLSQKSEFSQVEITKAPLRPPRRKNSVYVSLPPSSLRDRAIEELRITLETVGWSVITEEEGESYCANELQVSTYCAHLTRVGVIDTTGSDEVDLLQCYRLGLFVGKQSPWRVLHTNRSTPNQSLADPFTSLPSFRMKHWQTIDELKKLVLKFLEI